MWVLIDNYDSFTYILHHYLLQLHPEVTIFRNDAISVAELATLSPERIIISPGPQTPYEAGITLDVIRYFYKQIPILGICLGHQALGLHFGAKLSKAIKPVHGKTSKLRHVGVDLFEGVDPGIAVMRYHSLVVKNWEDTGLIPLAFTEEDELMAFRHNIYPCTGMQFHPESILTEHGITLLYNWDRFYR